jgi:ATP-dependent DNA helicase RecQ
MDKEGDDRLAKAAADLGNVITATTATFGQKRTFGSATVVIDNFSVLDYEEPYTELKDVTIPAQKLLCCIIRTNQRFGAGYVTDVLLGSKAQRIIDNGHNKISTWGIGTEYSKQEWMELTDLLIDEHYIRKTGDYNVLELTDAGKRFVASRAELKPPMREIKVRSYAASRMDRIVAEKPAANDELAEKIINNLKVWRKRKADDLNIAPYMIFGDKTLLDLAAKKPKNRSELLNIYGIGKAKAEEFGRSIIQIIEES